MAFCPICKGNHDPDVLCVDSAGRALKDMGIKDNRKISKKELSEVDKKARKSLIIFTFVLFWSSVLFVIYILSRRKF